MKNITASTNLDKLIEQGENSGLEFKSVKVSVDKIAKEFVAFSNSQGGILLLGVEDNGDITGVQESNKNYEEWITNIARNNVNPTIKNYINL
ncbi:MAG TPA: ATP-binding protein [Flavobacteriia bacterium]|nr:ATP-binding protein [Flavobacteriia bacterium]